MSLRRAAATIRKSEMLMAIEAKQTPPDALTRQDAAVVYNPDPAGFVCGICARRLPWKQIGDYLLHDAVTYSGWQPEGHTSAVHSHATNLEELRVEGRYRILTPDECVARGKQRGRFTDFILYPLCGGTPPEHGWRSLELYADKVLPLLEG